VPFREAIVSRELQNLLALLKQHVFRKKASFLQNLKFQMKQWSNKDISFGQFKSTGLNIELSNMLGVQRYLR